jgi:uncharacterized protein
MRPISDVSSFFMLRKLSYYGQAKNDKIRSLYSLFPDVTINSIYERIFRFLLHIIVICGNGGRTMIEEIIKLREDGLSFRKIASHLNTTIGRVQYRWSKYINTEKHQVEVVLDEEKMQKEDSEVKQTTIDYTPAKGELQVKLVNPRKVILYWEASKIPSKVINLFFERPFGELVHIVRIYDVTDIIFDGKNAHHYYDIAVPYNKGFWFIKGLTANRSYVAELGVKLKENEFFPILRSNSVQTPAMGNVNGSEIYTNLVNIQQIDNFSPKWIDHVSTYSYYAESKKYGVEK